MKEVKLGTRVRFRDGDEVLEGIVNGDPFTVANQDDHVAPGYDPVSTTYIPVHVQAGNKNMVVHEKNLVSRGKGRARSRV